jgi:hypothetical protein
MTMLLSVRRAEYCRSTAQGLADKRGLSGEVGQIDIPVRSIRIANLLQ